MKMTIRKLIRCWEIQAQYIWVRKMTKDMPKGAKEFWQEVCSDLRKEYKKLCGGRLTL